MRRRWRAVCNEAIVQAVVRSSRLEIKRAEGKLSNQGFVAKAPKALIDGEKAKVEKFTEIRNKILASIKEFEG